MEAGANGAFGVPAASRVDPERLSGPGDATVRPRDLEESVLGFLSKANFVMKVLVQEVGLTLFNHITGGFFPFMTNTSASSNRVQAS